MTVVYLGRSTARSGLQSDIVHPASQNGLPCLRSNEYTSFSKSGLSSFPWRIVISDWQDHTYAIGGDREHWCGQPLRIRFNNERGINDILALNGQGVLEDFVRGDVDMSGNLYVLTQIEKYLDLGSARWRLLGDLVKNRFFQTIERAKINVSSHYDIPQDVLRCYLDRTYMSYSCAMFEEPTTLDKDELTRPGQGRGDAFDSLEKGQWRKFKDAVEFIDPRPGDTLLDVGCGYGGQLLVALETGPFGKVVGCTHSHNQTVVGRQLLSEFDASKWELREADYREDSLVFDHVSSTGMISHVGPRGLVPYVRNIRQRIPVRWSLPASRAHEHTTCLARWTRLLESPSIRSTSGQVSTGSRSATT